MLKSTLALMLLVCSLLPGPALAAPQEVKPTVIQQSVNSRIRDRREVLIQDAKALQALWKEHTGTTLGIPQIDFNQQALVAAFLGRRNTAGYRIEISRVVQDPEAKTVSVYLQEVPPPADHFVAQVFTTPFVFATIPKPAYPVRFYSPEGKLTATSERTLLPMRNVSLVSNSFVTAPRQVVARDQASFQRLWLEHTGENVGAPEVDFSKEMVVAVFMGEKNTGGYQVRIVEVRQSAGQVEVVTEEKTPPEGSMVIQVLTAPAHLVVVPRSEGPVRFISGK